MNIQHEIISKSADLHLRRLVEIFCALGVEYKYRMSNTELNFFIENIKLQEQGIALDSSEATNILCELFPNSKDAAGQVYQYRIKLKKKKWLMTDKGKLMVHPFFDLNNHSDPWNISLQLKMQFKKNGSRPSLNISQENTI